MAGAEKESEVGTGGGVWVPQRMLTWSRGLKVKKWFKLEIFKGEPSVYGKWIECVMRKK